MSESAALWQAGFWKPVDVVIVVLLVLFGLVIGLVAFLRPEIHLLSFFLGAFVVIQLWSIMLCFRACHFALRILAKINLMPFESARIAAGLITNVEPPEQ